MKKLLSLVGGIAIGAILGILLAPQSGKDTREQIKKLIQEKMPNLSKERLEQLVDEVIAKLKNLSAESVECKCDEQEA